MGTLRGLSTRKQHNTRLSQRYKKNTTEGGRGEGGVAEHIKIAKILHILRKISVRDS